MNDKPILRIVTSVFTHARPLRSDHRPGATGDLVFAEEGRDVVAAGLAAANQALCDQSVCIVSAQRDYEQQPVKIC